MNLRGRDLKIAVLAAGFSTRLGQSKALTRIHGVSLLRRTLLTLRGAGLAEVLVIVPANASRYVREGRGLKAIFVRNPHRGRGLSSSVSLAVRRAHRAAALLLLPVDLARLSSGDIKRLTASWRSRPHVITASDSARRGGTPLVLPSRYFSRVYALRGDEGVRTLLSEIAPGAIRLVPMRSAHADIDTHAQLALARRNFRR